MVKNPEMQTQKETVIHIHPSTNVRSTQGDRWLFAVSEEYLQEFDQKKFDETGKPGGNVRRKAQLEKYNAYKQEIRDWVQRTGFKMPSGYFCIRFYIPFPKSWWPRKSKCRQMEGQPHTSTPDLDNLLKAFFDGIMPRKNKTKKEKGSDDRKIHCYTAFKTWCDQDSARIVISEYDPEEFTGTFPVLLPVDSQRS